MRMAEDRQNQAIADKAEREDVRMGAEQEEAAGGG